MRGPGLKRQHSILGASFAFGSCWSLPRCLVNEPAEATGAWPGVGPPDFAGWTSLRTPESLPPENREFPHPHAPTSSHPPFQLFLCKRFSKLGTKSSGICISDFVYSQVSRVSAITLFFPDVEAFIRMSWGREDINMGRGQSICPSVPC